MVWPPKNCARKSAIIMIPTTKSSSQSVQRKQIQRAMKLAYIISAYKNPEQLVRLVHALDEGSTSFWLHVDKRTDDSTFHRMTCGLSDIGRVRFLPRHRCSW